jgi:hypothetical protein
MASTANPIYGVVSVNGVQYLERWQVLPFQQNVITNAQVIAPIKIPLPGVYDFVLKGITRAIIVTATGVDVTSSVRFMVKFGNTDGAIWYSQGGNGGTTDRVVDSLICGNGQFPYPVLPALYYGKNAAINLEIQDISLTATAAPYTINFAFHGSYLIPV